MTQDDLIVLAMAKKYTNNKISEIGALSPFVYKGSVADYESLPTNAKKGEIYTTLDTNDEYLYDGSQWIKLGNDVTMEMITALQTGKQDKLVSGTTIKTINGATVLGSGDLEVSAVTKVDDVKVNGESVVTDKVANITTYTVTILE